MTYAISNTSGQWWTGTCWGVREAREEYGLIEDLPDELPSCNMPQSPTWEQWCNSEHDPLDIGYDDPDGDDSDGARVRELTDG